jgi:threonine dehydrogenase-like Zn-dependent dehydrogenase
VGVHAVAKAALRPAEAPLVVGCGPVGLAVVAALSMQGVQPIVAADYSPRRRALATHMGAHVVVDPAEAAPFERWREAAGAKGAVVFECVGVPGLLHGIMRDAPPQSRLVVAGACMEDDRIKPLIGIQKELQIQFVLGYTPDEFASALAALTEGRVDAGPLVTGRVDLGGVAGAFEDLGRPEAHAKILVEPWRR